MRKTNKIYSLIALMFCFAFCIQSLSAQETWTLRKCIDYAREHNIQVQKSQTTAQGYQVDVLQSRAALFPSLTGSTTQQFSNSKTVDGNGNYKYEGTLSGAYSLNASWTVYNGGKNKLAIKQAGMTKQAQDLTTQQQQNSIEISITQAYLQLLYYRESIKNYENLLETSTAELKQADLFLSAGTITRSDHAQVEAEYSSTKYNLVSARNSYDTYLVQLKQLLELEPQDSFRVEFPEVNENQVMQIIPAKEDVYRTALSIMPEVENSRMGVDIAKLTRQSAKAGYLPSIAIVGSVGTGNVYNQSTAFTTQLNRNFGQSLGLTVSIPIFDNRQNKSNVQKADLEIKTAELELQDTKKTLWKTIEGLYQDVVAGQSKYMAAQDQVRSTKLSYDLLQEQYKLGMKNTVDLLTQKNNYSNALQELLQAKYTALLSMKLLNFYQGQSITL